MIVCVAGALLERTELVEASPQNSGEANEINSMSLTVQPGERQRYFTRSRRSFWRRNSIEPGLANLFAS